MCYDGSGDGGCSYDPYENAQRPNAIVGKLHRLNIDAIAQQKLAGSTPALSVDQRLAACPAYASVVETVAIGVRYVLLHVRQLCVIGCLTDRLGELPVIRPVSYLIKWRM